MNDSDDIPPPAARRDFFKKMLAGVIGALLGLVPLFAGAKVFLDPLRRKSSGTGAIRVASLEALPDDGFPRRFQVLATRVDAWNKFSRVPVGAVYLRRTKNNKVEALNVVCPHAGGFVDYIPNDNCFVCPLHDSKFAIDGSINDRKSPAARGMDTLKVEIRKTNEIWVEFQNFQAGTAKKIPVT